MGSSSRSVDVVQIVLGTHPAALQVKSNFGQLPLHLACKNQTDGAAAIAALVLAADPDAVKQPDDGRRLPLHIACGNSGSVDVVQMVLDAYPAAMQVKNK